MFSYVHIPFCRRKCPYCKFALTPIHNTEKIQTYLNSLNQEVESFFREERSSRDHSLESIYFGGGTPSLLAREGIEQIIKQFAQIVPFSENIEITLEANPEDLSREKLFSLKNIGINRLSIGVQSLDDRVLQTILRAPSEQILRSLDFATTTGYENISIDLITGLPWEKSGAILEAIKTLTRRYPIRHVSVYMLEQGRYPKEWTELLPGEDQIVQEYLDARDVLQDLGFIQYELSNFAIPGYESRHNQSYWNHSNVRGFGLSAASYYDGSRFANSQSFQGYYARERAYEEHLSSDQKRIEHVMFGFRTNGIDKTDIGNIAWLEENLRKGFIEKRGDRIFPTSTWIFLLDHIMGELI